MPTEQSSCAPSKARESEEQLPKTLAFYFPNQLLPSNWRFFPDRHYRGKANLFAGALLGAIAGAVSLLSNAVATLLVSTPTDFSQNTFRLIQVYLTFPLGESALHLNGGRVLGGGIILYLLTGMLYGAICEAAISYVFPRARWKARTLLFTLVAILLWLINFYCIVSWLQPLVTGGNWILQLVPWWVAAATHLVFGVTLASIYPIAFRSESTHVSLAEHDT